MGVDAHYTVVMEFRKILTDEEYNLVYPVLKELRSTPSLEQVMLLSREAGRRDDFQWIAAFHENQCLGVIGFRILFDLTHGKHVYVDDLVVTESKRSSGVGAKLIEFAEAHAKEFDCEALRLSTGIDNVGAQKFYARIGWEKRSCVFKKFLKKRF